ncbi:MAG: glycosyltransferase family 4 protein [bacterium]|nr:glycosyltransferase family 4 protein [bacterium]MDD7722777.1 glycosyltransferase family 4 protein [bacterium]MDY4101740.1 glycosyltransferase family 4 protein [Parabacteroides sp.]
MLHYVLIFLLLLVAEVGYFRIADRCNIIDRPNERSSHASIVLRGGGIIFLVGLWLWALKGVLVDGVGWMDCYPFFLLAVTLVAGVSWTDDIRSLPDSVRLVAQFVAMGLMFYQLGLYETFQVSESSVVSGIVVPALIVLLAIIVCVGASNIINFMDGINGITGGYALASLLPIYLLNQEMGFVEEPLVVTVVLADVVFCLFNFRPKGKAKCFAGDVGSIGMAFILLFLIGRLVMQTGDMTYLIFLVVYGVDGCLTIIHRILLHENLGEAHRKHAYQLMANELKIGHVKVSLLYMGLQLAISLAFVFWVPNSVGAHWLFLSGSMVVLSMAYVIFMKKYYHLHEAYLQQVANKS